MSQLEAFKAMKAIVAELEQLEKHTHGFAYPDCPKCRRIDEIKSLLRRP